MTSDIKMTEAVIHVSILHEEIDINQITDQIEEQLGWCVDRAWIKGSIFTPEQD